MDTLAGNRKKTRAERMTVGWSVAQQPGESRRGIALLTPIVLRKHVKAKIESREVL